MPEEKKKGRPVITLITDFGEGYYVAAMKGVILASKTRGSSGVVALLSRYTCCMLVRSYHLQT